MGSLIEYTLILLAGVGVFFLYPYLVRRHNARNPTKQIELKPWMPYLGLGLAAMAAVRIAMVFLRGT